MQLADYQFNNFQCNFLNWQCFLFCDVSPTFFLYNVTMWFFFFSFTFYIVPEPLHYGIPTCVSTMIPSFKTVFANIFGGRSWVLIQSHQWMSVKFIHGYSHIWGTVILVSIVCLLWKLSRRMIISLIQISLSLMDSIWRAYMLVKPLVQLGGPFVWYSNVVFWNL